MSPFKIKYVMKNIFILMLGLLLFSNSYAQKKSKAPESVSQLIAGPMLGVRGTPRGEHMVNWSIRS
jgi:hypothetical protein